MHLFYVSAPLIYWHNFCTLLIWMSFVNCPASLLGLSASWDCELFFILSSFTNCYVILNLYDLSCSMKNIYFFPVVWFLKFLGTTKKKVVFEQVFIFGLSPLSNIEHHIILKTMLNIMCNYFYCSFTLNVLHTQIDWEHSCNVWSYMSPNKKLHVHLIVKQMPDGNFHPFSILMVKMVTMILK